MATIIVSTTSDTLYSSCTPVAIDVSKEDYITKDKQQFSVYQPENIEEAMNINTLDNENKKHINNTVNKLTTRNTNSKDTEIVTSDFENWVNSHGGETNLVAFIRSGHSTVVRRKRSNLSRVSYSSSDEESSDDETESSISSSDEEEEQQQQTYYKKGNKENNAKNNKPNETSKKPSWFTGLFQKQSNTVKPIVTATLPKKPSAISGFFTSKKQQQQQQRKQIVEKKKPHQHNNKTSTNNNIPSRYPAPIERAIYQISFTKLSNPRRPLLQQVSISNMIYQYTSMIRNQIAMHSSKKQSIVLSSMMYQKPSYGPYIPPRSASTAVVGH